MLSSIDKKKNYDYVKRGQYKYTAFSWLTYIWKPVSYLYIYLHNTPIVNMALLNMKGRKKLAS